MLAFARKQTIVPQILNLNDTVSSMLKMLRRLIGENKELVWIPGERLESVKMDPGQIDQILANLAVNACDAIGPDKGKITITTENVSFCEENYTDLAGVEPGRYVRLSVSDDGCGMDEETRKNIFEPFFTTKGIGEGTGLGLATVYGIVKQNQGFINVESDLGVGTTFRIYLSAQKEDPSYIPPEESSKEFDVGRKIFEDRTVLLVEDEPAILNLTRTMLEKHGYTVIAASSPGQAIQKVGRFSGLIDLLLTDVVMPEMNGYELAKSLHMFYPDLHCLFMSGYTADAIANQGIVDKTIYFLQKPFSEEDLLEKVQQALQGPTMGM